MRRVWPVAMRRKECFGKRQVSVPNAPQRDRDKPCRARKESSNEMM